MADARVELDLELERARTASAALAARLDDVAARSEATRLRLEQIAAEKTNAQAGAQTCLACSGSLAGKRRDARYCSTTCRRRAARARAR